MRIAVLSDTHNRTEVIQKAIDLLEGFGVELILHCGDIEDPEIVSLFPRHTHFVFGNCDSDRKGLRQAIAELGGTLHEPFGTLEVPDANVAFVHGDDSHLLYDLENCGHFDYLFHGHTHVAGERRNGKTRIINPGALHRARPKTLAVVDLASALLQSVIVAS